MTARPSLLLFCALLALPGVSGAATFTVTKTANTDDGTCDSDCSVREAVGAANASAGFDDVVIPAGTYVVAPGLVLSDDVTVAGAGMTQTTLDADLQGTALQIGAGVTAGLEDLAITRGAATPATIFVPGGVWNEGALTLRRVRLHGNSGVTAGAVLSDGTLHVEDSVIENNFTVFGGGGLTLNDPSAVIRTIVRGNRADLEDGGTGGIVVSASVSVTDCVIEANVGPSGGGITVDSSGDLTLVRSAVVENEARTIEFHGPVFGGGIAVLRGLFGPGGSFSIVNSTISGNFAEDEGEGSTTMGWAPASSSARSPRTPRARRLRGSSSSARAASRSARASSSTIPGLTAICPRPRSATTWPMQAAAWPSRPTRPAPRTSRP